MSKVPDYLGLNNPVRVLESAGFTKGLNQRIFTSGLIKGFL
jgi:hypothetical protein